MPKHTCISRPLIRWPGGGGGEGGVVRTGSGELTLGLWGGGECSFAPFVFAVFFAARWGWLRVFWGCRGIVGDGEADGVVLAIGWGG